jgi:hypothetical protein
VSASDGPLSALATALRERRRIVADREFYRRDPAAHLAQLQAVSEQIVRLGAGLPPPVPGELAHFLERCSYDKALAWIEEHTALAES